MTNSNRFIPITKPFLGENEVEATKRPILSGWVTQGPEVAAFEREFCNLVGAKYAIAVSNCTSALHLALLAAGIKPGDEVITASHSFIATANSIRYCGGIPVFVDIDPGTFNIMPENIEAAITDKIKAILCIHQIGIPCDINAITQIGTRHNIPVIEDAACAIGCEIRVGESWEKIGKPHGDAACFSFHPRKIITTGDGGMITTNNPEWDRKFRLWRQHSMGVTDAVRHKSDRVIFEEYAELGYNYRMTDIQAAIGREQLKRLPEIISRRRLIAKRYAELLADTPEIILQQEPDWARSNWQSFYIRLPDNCDQVEVMQYMLDRGIATRRGVMCVHLEPAYKTQEQCRVVGKLVESEKAMNRTICLPLFHQLSDEEQVYVAAIIEEAVTR